MMVASVTYTKKPDFTLEDGFVAVEDEDEVHNVEVSNA
jgi:hypothetical protein